MTATVLVALMISVMELICHMKQQSIMFLTFLLWCGGFGGNGNDALCWCGGSVDSVIVSVGGYGFGGLVSLHQAAAGW